MPVVKPFRNLTDKNTGEVLNVPAARISKKLGPGAGFGFADLGKAEWGDDRMWAGTYQKRVTGYNNRGRNPARVRRTYTVRIGDCTPGNPQTYLQQLTRRKMSLVHKMWQGLTTEQKTNYNEAGKGKPRNGYNIFTSQNMRRSTDHGKLGHQSFGVALWGGELILLPH